MSVSSGDLYQETIRSFDEISSLLTSGGDMDIVVSRLISIEEANLELDPNCLNTSWYQKVTDSIEILSQNTEAPRRVGRPTVPIDVNAIEVLLNMNFRATKIAQLLNVSYRTLQRRMQEAEISVKYIFYEY